MDTIEQRLRKRTNQIGMALTDPPKPLPDAELMNEAADTIAKQAAQIERLREALEAIAKCEASMNGHIARSAIKAAQENAE